MSLWYKARASFLRDIDMAKKGNIVQYRERLDNTLASPDLTNDQILKKLIKSQLQRSSKLETEGNNNSIISIP